MLSELAATLAHEPQLVHWQRSWSNTQAGHRFLTMASPQLESAEALEDVIADTRRAAELLQRLRALTKKPT
jgi:hypothetical protein